jgi:hypothetical protein
MPRTLVALALLFALLVTPAVATAQEATPAAGADRRFTDLTGLPELALTGTADGYEGVPAAIAAGRYLVTLASAEDVEFGAAVEFLLLPEGVAFADFAALLEGFQDAAMAPMASPPAGEGEASPVAGGAGPAVPEWYFATYLAGGVAADPGFSAQVVLDLRPGTYVVWPGEPGASQAPVELRVTGEAGATPTAAEPAADATITMYEYGFTVEGELTAGPQVLKITNVGAQPHFTIMVRPEEPVTREQVKALLEAELAGMSTADAAAAAGVSDPEQWALAAYAGTLSRGATEWIPVELEPGPYVLVCFVPDLASGMPHAYLGMYDVVAVGDGGA